LLFSTSQSRHPDEWDRVYLRTKEKKKKEKTILDPKNNPN